jgi:hypothetical protein
MYMLSATAFARHPSTLRLWRLACMVVLIGFISACSGVKLVADYDAEAAKGITDTSAEVFSFYDRLIEAKAKAGTGKLPYASAAEDWGKIESRIRVLVVREEARLLNSESQRIVASILEFWQQRRAEHRTKDDYVAALVPQHRDQFQKLFTAALVAEKAKALAVEDGGTKKN